MRIILAIIILSFSSISFAQVNWPDESQLTTEAQSSTTAFSVDISNEDVSDTIMALCDNNGFKDCDDAVAHNVVVNYLKQQLRDYRTRIKINSFVIPEGDIQ